MFDVTSSSIIICFITSHVVAKYSTFLYWADPYFVWKDSVLDQGEGPWGHAPSLIIYLKENKAF